MTPADKRSDSPRPRSPRQTQSQFDVEFFRAVLLRAPDYVDVLRSLGDTLSQLGQHGDALEIDRRLARLRPADSVVRYNLACSLALGGAREEAIRELRAALENGYDDLEHLEADADLDTLRDEPEYRRLMRDFGLFN